MSIQHIIQRIMSLDVTKESLQNRMKALEIQTELRQIRDEVTKLLDSLSPLIKGRGRVAAQDELEPVLITLCNLTDEAAQALYDKLDKIDELTQCIQKSRPLGSLVGALYRRLNHNTPIADKHVQIAKLVELNAVCISNITMANEKIITQLNRHGLAVALPAENSDVTTVKQYYTLLEATITTYAEIDPTVKFYQQQHKAFLNMQNTLYEAKESAENRCKQFHTQLVNYFYSNDDVPEQNLDHVLVETDSDNRILDKSLEHTNYFKNAVRDKIDAELKKANLYLSMEEFRHQSTIQSDDKENEAERCANLLKRYCKDRHDKINLLAACNPRVYELQSQYSSIRRAESQLTDTTVSLAERGAKHVQIAKLVDLDAVCVSNIVNAEEKIITQLQRHGVSLSIPATNSDLSAWEQYYALQEATFTTYAEIDPYVKLYMQQYTTFHHLQNTLFAENESADNRLQQFHAQLANYLKNQAPIPVITLDRIQIDSNNDNIFLEAMYERTHAFMNEVRDTIDAELKKANLDLSFEDFCLISSGKLHGNKIEPEAHANRIKKYDKDRHDKINLLTAYNPQFNELRLQYSAICCATSKLTNTKLPVAERRANFENYVMDNVKTLKLGNELAANKWLSRILIFFAAVITIPLLGVGGFIAYQALKSPTTGSRYMTHFKQLNRSLTEPLLKDDSINLIESNSPRQSF